MRSRTLPRVRELKLGEGSADSRADEVAPFPGCVHCTDDMAGFVAATARRTLPRVRELKPVYQYNGRSRRWCRTLPRVRELKPK